MLLTGAVASEVTGSLSWLSAPSQFVEKTGVTV